MYHWRAIAPLFGQRAKQAASALVYTKALTPPSYGKDKYRRTIADVCLADSTRANHDLVRMAGAGDQANAKDCVIS